jgi:hypothetical protein
MASLQYHLETLAGAIGTDIKGLRNMIGILANLTTDAKGNLVSSINEVDAHTDVINANLGGNQTAIGNAVGVIGDRTIVQALAELYAEIMAEVSTRTLVDNALAADIAEVEAAIGNLIDDTAIAGSTTRVYSADKIISLLLALESKIIGRVAVVENKSEVFIDELPEGDYPAIAFVKIPGTNEYAFKVRAGQ